MTKDDQLFNQGIAAFNKRQFYDAHEYWEELWLEYKLDDAKFIQGLIQLAVSYFHFFNKNLNKEIFIRVFKLKSIVLINLINFLKLLLKYLIT